METNDNTKNNETENEALDLNISQTEEMTNSETKDDSQQPETVDSVIQYKCPKCGAPIKFSPNSQSITCDYCSNTFDLSEIKTDDEQEETESFDWGDYKKNLSNEKLSDTLVYSCTSCGASIETDSTTMATVCPYCNNNVVLNKNAAAGLKPNLIIPFKIKKEEAHNILKNFYNKKKLLPKDFFTKSRIGEIKGVYVPFWLFDSELKGSVVFHGEKKRTYTSGSNSYEETKVFKLTRAGRMKFKKIPVDASVKMDNALMDSLEPFDYSQITEFNKKYLAGYLADRFDSDPDTELPRAEKRMLNKAIKLFQESTHGYVNVRAKEKNLQIENPNVTYAMLPVYILDCEFESKTYRYVINGQTGKIVGDLPIAFPKVILWSLISFFMAFGILTIIHILLLIFVF